MTRTPHLLLGVDTGGTYTDAVLLEADSHEVVASAKALTTRGDLAIGVSAAIDAISGGLNPADVQLVSVSTTLATNAVVEGHGSPVLVLLVGFDDAMVARSGIASAFGDVIIERVAGGHDHHGNEREPLDLDRVDSLMAEHGPAVRAVAVASSFAVRNPSHEEATRIRVVELTELPVTVSSELSESLDAPRRALTAALNARLLSRISDLVEAVQRSLDRLEISAPMMIAKGDGSLAVAHAVALRPIETILSGPAASMVGAAALSGERDFILSDIGGTTTDVGMSIDRRPRLAPDGAKVGGWRTMVRAIDVRTTGLGGDSEVRTERQAITVGPRRFVPVSLIGETSDSVMKWLKAELDDPSSRDLAAQFVIRPTGAAPVVESLSSIETRIMERVLDDEPMPLAEVAVGAVERKSLHALAERGHVQLAGFTPSDAAHVLGMQENWSTEAAVAAAEVMAWYTGLSAEEFCQRVWSETVRRSAATILEVAFDDTITDPEHHPLVDAAINGTGQLAGVKVALTPTMPIVAVGGPAEIYYPEVAVRTNSQLVIPEQFFVANAVGAAAGVLVAHGTAEVHTDGPGLFRVLSTSGVETATDGTAALALAHTRAEALARAALDELAAGLPSIGEIALSIDCVRHDQPDAQADEGLYFASVEAEATARPYA